MIIFNITLAISMVAGISYYTNSYEQTTIQSTYQQVCDISVESLNKEINFSSSVLNHINEISQEINETGLALTSTYRYGFLDSNSLMTKNYTTGSSNYNMTMPLSVFVSNGEFYQTNAFSDHFTLEKGYFPSNQSEILIDKYFADNFDYHAGDIINLTINYKSSTYNISNLKVSGIYSCNSKYRSYEFFDQFFTHNYSGSEQIFGSQSVNVSKDLETLPIFSYKNFADQNDSSPFQLFGDFMAKIHDVDTVKDNLGFQYGVGVTLDKNNISFKNLRSTNLKIKNQLSFFSTVIPYGFEIRNYISDELTQLEYTTNNQRYSLMLMTIPILIFSVIIGSFSMKINVKSRSEEFLLMLSKGTPKKMVRNQLITESLINGTIAAIFGCLLGIAMFEINKIWLNDLIFYNQTPPEFPLAINYQSIIEIILFSIGLTVLSSISSIKYMKKINFSDLLKSMGEEEMQIEYNENTLFGMSKGSSVNLAENKIVGNKDSNHNEKSFKIEKNQKSKLTSKKDHKLNGSVGKIKGSSKYYKNIVKNSQKKIKKTSYIFIIISIFPVIIYLLGQWSISSNPPDFLLDFTSNLAYILPALSLFLLITPLLMAIGIIRYLTIENPARFAKIVRFISKPFLKAKSYLVGLEMIKRKQFRTVIFIVGIFSSVFVFSNISFNSTDRYSSIANNLSIGADLKISGGDYYIFNTSEINNLDKSLIKITNPEGLPIVKDVLPLDHRYEFYFGNEYFLNFSKYSNIISGDGKFLPKNLTTELSSVINYDANPSNTYAAAIVDNTYLQIHSNKIGDQIAIIHTQYDSERGKTEQVTIHAKIVAVSDRLPGVYGTDYGSGSGRIAIDSRFLNQSVQLLHTDSINMLIDLNLKASSNDTLIQKLIQNSTSSYIPSASFAFYDLSWNSPTLKAVTESSGSYGVLYVEFIILGILLSIGLAVLMNSFQNKNRYLFGILIARGFGKKGVFTFMISQLLILFLLAIVSGLVSGIITSVIFMKIFSLSYASLNGLMLPVYFTAGNMLEILGIIVIISFVMYTATYLFQIRKSISQYMRKF